MNGLRARPTSMLLLAAIVVAGCEREPPGALSVVEVTGPAGEGAAQQRLVAAGGDALLSWLEPAGDDFALRFAMLDGADWSAPRTVAVGDDWFINWADTPSVLPASDEVWAAHWLRRQPESYFAYDIFVAFSSDQGATWSEPSLLHQDGTESEHGFVTLFPEGDGISAVWLDGRNYLVDGVYLYEDPDGNKLGTGLRHAHFDATGGRLSAEAIDEMVCDCCLPDVAQAAGGPVVAYRDRTVSERRDIVVSRMQEGTWQGPVSVGFDDWIIEACPINGPAIAADGSDVVVAWFTASNNAPFVRLARSSDGGRSFGEPMDLDSGGSFGHVDIALSETGDAFVSWLRSADTGIELVVRRVSDSGVAGETLTVASVDIGRPADFPQMIRAGDRLVFAWTDFDGAGTVKTAVADLDR
ncbi:MAG TPA: sialidase family protein [Gammaproteobacteria bacterium]